MATRKNNESRLHELFVDAAEQAERALTERNELLRDREERYEKTMQGWAERSGEVMFSEYMNGAMIARGLNAQSAAIAIQLAFPEETQQRTPIDIAAELDCRAEMEYKRIANEYYTPTKVYG
jgi:hypothetical protein